MREPIPGMVILSPLLLFMHLFTLLHSMDEKRKHLILVTDFCHVGCKTKSLIWKSKTKHHPLLSIPLSMSFCSGIQWGA